MAKVIEINPSVAGEINIDPIGFKELVNVYFTASEDLAGEYDFHVYNSDKKNSVIHPENVLTIAGRELKLAIQPETNGLPLSKSYIEVTHIPSKRVHIKGWINIVP